MFEYLNGARKDDLVLLADNLHVIKWYVEESFTVCPDILDQHWRRNNPWGQLYPIYCLHKNMNTWSSTKSEIIGANNTFTMIIWKILFLEPWGYDIDKNILYQENNYTILLEKNGKESSIKWDRALSICYLFLTYQIEMGNLHIEYWPTLEMIGDFMLKPLKIKLWQKLC